MALDIQDFKEAGFNEVQAKLLAKVLSDKLYKEIEEDIIIKKDLIINDHTIRAELNSLKQGIKSESHEIKNALERNANTLISVRSDLQEFRTELRKEISEVKNDTLELKGDIKALRTGASWNMAVVLAILTILLSSVIKFPL